MREVHHIDSISVTPLPGPKYTSSVSIAFLTVIIESPKSCGVTADLTLGLKGRRNSQSGQQECAGHQSHFDFIDADKMEFEFGCLHTTDEPYCSILRMRRRRNNLFSYGANRQ